MTTATCAPGGGEVRRRHEIRIVDGLHGPLAFYEDGDVADSQHRLMGGVGGRITVEFIVVRGLARDRSEHRRGRAP
jgi:hypothetical protein